LPTGSLAAKVKEGDLWRLGLWQPVRGLLGKGFSAEMRETKA